MKLYNSLMQKLANYGHELRVVFKYLEKRKRRRIFCDIQLFKDISVSWISLGTQSHICFYIVYDDSHTTKADSRSYDRDHVTFYKKSLPALN